MPEGHSVRRLANRFQEWFVGQTCYLTSPQGRFSEGAARLNGLTMVDAFSVGKHMFLRFEGAGEPLWLQVHLGLYGAWRFYRNSGEAELIGAPMSLPTPGAVSTHWQPPEPRGAVRVRITTQEAAADLNGPNQCQVLRRAEVEEIIDRLGPDPLDHETDVDVLRNSFVSKVRASGRAVGELVMDQSVSAGVGNIYRAEALFRRGISPFRKGNNVSVKRLEALWDDFVFLLNEGVKDGQIRTLEPEDRSEVDGDNWYVYQRADEPCKKCGTPVSNRQVAGRNVYWCRSCQR